MFIIRYIDDFEYSQVSKNIYGTFYVECNSVSFPDSQWTDLPIAVLRMWCENIISSVTNTTEEKFQLCFMDGPFSIECKRKLDTVKMEFVDKGKHRKVYTETVINIWELARSIYKTSIELLDRLKDTEFYPINDEDQLKTLAHKLKGLEIECRKEKKGDC